VELDGCIESWRVQYIGVGGPSGWKLLRGNPRAAAPGALAPKTAPMGWGLILTQEVALDNPYD
jgi:hypothetical protein